jgi:hypothetical protein
VRQVLVNDRRGLAASGTNGPLWGTYGLRRLAPFHATWRSDLCEEDVRDSLGDTLAIWREADRLRASLPAESQEHASLSRVIAQLRSTYVRVAQGAPPNPADGVVPVLESARSLIETIRLRGNDPQARRADRAGRDR